MNSIGWPLNPGLLGLVFDTFLKYIYFFKYLLDEFWLLFGYFLDTFKRLLGYIWDIFGLILDTFGIPLSYIWDTFGIIF
jgi:hypothetical protein